MLLMPALATVSRTASTAAQDGGKITLWFDTTGGAETAHQIVNDSDADLCYLSISTMAPAEVCEYPDSKKVGAYGRSESRLRHLTEAAATVDYWKGE